MTWNYVEITGLLLFLIGFYGLIARRNIIKTILSLGIMDISVILFFLGIRFEAGMRPPIGESAAPAADPGSPGADDHGYCNRGRRYRSGPDDVHCPVSPLRHHQLENRS